MIKKKTVGRIIGVWAVTSGFAAHILKKKAEKTTYTADAMDPIRQREMSFYERYVKRLLDIACASAALTIFSPLYLIVALLVRLKLGSPILFVQDRPGLIGSDGKERIFKMYKFRTMTDERDEKGNLLSDEIRLTKFGKKLRSTSFDELPEAINILNGSMSVIGPRPQLVKDLVFMSNEHRLRHTAKPGLSGLAQIEGRNAIKWEDKLSYDLQYVGKINFIEDVRIISITFIKVFLKANREDSSLETDVTLDYGDELLHDGVIGEAQYNELVGKSKVILS